MTKEEEELLIRLEAQFEGNKNINKLIAGHTSQAKQLNKARTKGDCCPRNQLRM